MLFFSNSFRTYVLALVCFLHPVHSPALTVTIYTLQLSACLFSWCSKFDYPGNSCLPRGPTLSAAIPKGQHVGPEHWVHLLHFSPRWADPTLSCQLASLGLYPCSYILLSIRPNGSLSSPFQSFPGALCHSLALVSKVPISSTAPKPPRTSWPFQKPSYSGRTSPRASFPSSSSAHQKQGWCTPASWSYTCHPSQMTEAIMHNSHLPASMWPSYTDLTIVFLRFNPKTHL